MNGNYLDQLDSQWYHLLALLLRLVAFQVGILLTTIILLHILIIRRTHLIMLTTIAALREVPVPVEQ